MEVPEYCMGGYFSAGVDTLSPDKRHAEQKPGENFVDELLDFSNDDVMITEGFLENVDGNSTDSSTITPVDSYNSSVSGGGDNHFSLNMDSRGFADSQFSGDLGVPYEDLAQLEWLSNFVEDSFSTEDELKTLHLLSGATASKIATNPHTPESSSSCETPRNASPVFHPETPLPGKARSKRSRAAPGNWSSLLLHAVNPMAPTANNTMKFMPVDLKPIHPKSTPIKRRENSHSDTGSDRKCLHCATEKTPQWRTGPLGPKTLCNACGVRYKSGRLVPEYRPAASPTFVSTKHSNSHRKVLELRRQKDLVRQQHHQQQQFLSQTSIFGVSNGGDEYLVHRHSGSDYRHVM